MQDFTQVTCTGSYRADRGARKVLGAENAHGRTDVSEGDGAEADLADLAPTGRDRVVLELAVPGRSIVDADRGVVTP